MGTAPTDRCTTVEVAAPHPIDEERPVTSIGGSLGRYVVVEEIARGGMGRVLRAYDPKLQREVALKELRRATLGSQGTARLVAEARAMAKLSHPNVVAVFDVEELPTTELALVMEYVPGTTLRTWQRNNGPPWADIIDRYVEAGRGLAAAHGAGLLHRDFKPANVLLSPTGRVKVTDFGLAKGVRSASTGLRSSSVEASAEELTEAGTLLGTPRYMAPEQHDSEKLTEAADQYAFCVALWEALTGQAPFTGDDLGRQKREGPPPWPNASAPRRVTEAIVRGLSPLPSDRWPDMNALLDILSYDPRRRRVRWLGGLAAAALLGTSATVWTWWARARSQRCSGAAEQIEPVWNDARRVQVETAILAVEAPYTASVWTRTASTLDRYAEGWVAMHGEACEATTVRAEQSATVMDLRMACLHRARVDLEAVVDVLATADAGVAQNAHDLLGELRPLQRCADVAALQAEVEPPAPGDVEGVEVARTRLARARAERKAGRYQAAATAVDDARTALTKVDYGPLQAELSLVEGDVLEKLGEYDAAEQALERSLQSAGRWRQTEVLASAAVKLLYVVGFQQRRFEEGLRYLALARGLAQDAVGEAEVRDRFAVVLSAQGKHQEAEAEHRRALALRKTTLGPDDPSVAASHHNLGLVLEDEGKYQDAESEYRQALAVLEAALGPGHPNVASTRGSLAGVLGVQGKHEEAEAERRQVLALRKVALGPHHPHVAATHNNLASVLYAAGRYDESEAEIRRALAVNEIALGPDHPDTTTTRSNLGEVLRVQGKHAEAETELRATIAQWEEVLGPDHPDIAAPHNNLALALVAQEKFEEAELEYRRAMALWEKALGPDHPRMALSHCNLAELALTRGRPRDAVEFGELAWAANQRDDVAPLDRAYATFVLARALWESGDDRSRARTLAANAAKNYRDAGACCPEAVAEVEAWLTDHPLR